MKAGLKARLYTRTFVSIRSVALLTETNREDGYLHGSFCTVSTEHFGHYFLYPVYLVSYSFGNVSSCYREMNLVVTEK